MLVTILSIFYTARWKTNVRFIFKKRAYTRPIYVHGANNWPKAGKWLSLYQAYVNTKNHVSIDFSHSSFPIYVHGANNWPKAGKWLSLYQAYVNTKNHVSIDFSHSSFTGLPLTGSVDKSKTTTLVEHASIQKQLWFLGSACTPMVSWH